MNRIMTIAREDLRHAVRDRLAWGSVVLLGLMFLPSTASIASSGHRTIEEFLLMMPLDLISFALVVIAAVGYNSIVGERASGTVRLVLGLAGTRRDLVLGKLLSRGAIVVLALTVILTIANVLVLSGYGKPYLAPFWVMAAWMLVYGVVWTAITVGYSAAFSSQYRALGALVVTYVTFSPNFGVWGVIVRPVFAFVFTGSLSTPTYDELVAAPLWLRVTERFNPLIDFWEAMRWSIESVGPGSPTGGPIPHLFGTAVFLLFGAIPLAYGCVRFEQTDLGSEESRLQLGNRLWRLLSAGMGTVLVLHSEVDSPTAPSRVRTIAREDVRHALQNWVVMGGIVVTVLLVGPSLWQSLDPNSVWTVSQKLANIPHTFSLPILVLGMAVGYRAVVGEREAGTVRLVLGLPATRREVVLGKLLSRVAITVCTLLPLLLFAEALVVVRFGAVYPVAFFLWAGYLLYSGVVWTSAVVGFSAAVSSHYRSLAATFGTYLLFSPGGAGLWNPVIRPLLAFLFAGTFSVQNFMYAADGGPLWFRYTDHLNPFVALTTVQEYLLGIAGIGLEGSNSTVPLVIYSFVVTLLFAIAPLYLGYKRFERRDLG